MSSVLWRLKGIATSGGGELELSTLHLCDQGGRLDLQSVLSSTHPPKSGTLANLQNDLPSGVVKFEAADIQSSGFALVWQLVNPVDDVPILKVGSGEGASGFLGGAYLEQFDAATGRWINATKSSWLSWPGAVSQVSAAMQPSAALIFKFESFVSQTGEVWVPSGGAVITQESSKSGSSLKLTGSSSGYVACSKPDVLDFGAEDFTIEMWINPSSAISSQQFYGLLISSDTIGGVRSLTWGVTPQFGLRLNFWPNSSNALSMDSAVGAVVANQWQHVAISRAGNSFRMFVGGVQVASMTSSSALQPANAAGATIGTNYSRQSGTFYTGYIDEVRITKGRALYQGPFEPFAALPSWVQWPLRSYSIDVNAINGDELIPGLVMRSLGIQNFKDVEFGGAGRIWGTNEIETGPGVRIPAGGRVFLLRQRDKLLVRETWASPSTGEWEFLDIDIKAQYLVLAEDLEGNYRPVAANRIVPEEVV